MPDILHLSGLRFAQRAFLDLFALRNDDAELARAQFQSFSKQMPLLYLILICNTAAVMVAFFKPTMLFETFGLPVFICMIAIVRAAWWWRQDGAEAFSDEEIATQIRRTCMLAVAMTLAFECWCMWIYSSGDAYARGHLTFFLGLTQVSTVFCLMTMRAAAMRVAATSTLVFVVFFTMVDHGQMMVVAVVLGCVGVGMMIVTHRYNLDFSKLICSQRDLRNRQAETEKLSDENRRIALTDALSGLPNRRQLLVNLDRIDERNGAAPDELAILFIDLDGFKTINDTHGHQAGDSLIRSVSVRIGQLCPPCSMLARVGGDEFVILIETPGAAAVAESMAERISDEIGLPVLINRHVLQVGASIGIATNVSSICTSHELLRRADTAMYHVKTGTKGKIATYTSAMDRGRLRRMEIEAEIGTGLINEEFDVVYQPVVDAQSEKIVATEALIRWPRRPAGVLVPQQFIAIAEATGQIHPLGMFVLERACRDVGPLRDMALSVNVSPAQFRDPGFLRQVAHVLEQTRFPPHRLQLEITEGYLLSQPETAIRTIKSFKAMGLSIALDDFGTGFTSIHYLRTYGFSHVKIDKSLLATLSPNSKASLLVAGAINLARGLDMEVTAEGVETREQAKLLREAGCDRLQGFLFGRPMPIASLRALCDRHDQDMPLSDLPKGIRAV
jgi:diguanylate cyclase (GGDEF)-like protein